MTTIRQIITDAYREAGIIAIEDTLDADKFAEGLRRMNAVLNSLFDDEFGEPLRTANYGLAGLTNAYALAQDESDSIDSIYVPSNTRLMLNIDAAATLYLDPNPRDGARLAVVDNGGNLATYNVTINANGRKIESANSVILNTNSINRQWFYREDLGSWTRVADLIDGDSSPFPSKFDDFLASLLAFRIGPRHGAPIPDASIEILKRGRRTFRARYRQVKTAYPELGIVRLPSSKKYWASDGSF